MLRLPLLPADLSEPRELVAMIRERRGGTFIDLDRLLLYSPALAAGWSALLREVRTKLVIDPMLRELAICAVAMLNDAHYEFGQHAPEFLKAGGDAEFLAAVKKDIFTAAASPHASDAMRAVLNLTIEMTKSVAVLDATFDAARNVMGGDRELVELVGVIATYNMVSRFLVALKLGE